MKIIVLMKQVANKDAILRINKDLTWIKEKTGGEVVVCSMGPQRAKSVIKDALARGADRAIHVIGDNLSHLSPYSAARALAEAIKAEQADLIMTGLQSDD